jgi:putative selenium metabolism protein SsnA
MLALLNARILNLHPPSVSDKTDLIIDKGIILDVGSGFRESYKPDRIIDLNGKYIFPGLVCSHNHFYSFLARGLTAKIKPSKNFEEILTNLWWKLDFALDEESLYYSGMIGALESIKCGTTSVVDHNSSPNYIKGSLSTLKKCFDKSGLRGILCYEVSDRNGEKGTGEGIEESIGFAELIDKVKNENHLVETAMGAHASFTLSDKTLSLLVEAVVKTGRGIHIHVSEDLMDEINCYNDYEISVIERLEKFNLLNDKSILAHGVHLSEREIDIVNSHESFLIHNPRSNMNNDVGYCERLNLFNNLALGTDGIGSDMIEELKFAYFRNKDSKNKIEINEFIKFLQNGNLILNRYFNNKFGTIEKGYTADIVVFDYNSPTLLTDENLAGHLIFGFSSRDVETVIINGKIVYENRMFPFNVTDIYQEASNAALKMWRRIENII